MRATGSNWFRSLLDFDQAHPTVASYFEPFVIAESRNFDAIFLGCLIDGKIVIDLSYRNAYLVRLAINEDLDLLGGE